MSNKYLLHVAFIVFILLIWKHWRQWLKKLIQGIFYIILFYVNNDFRYIHWIEKLYDIFNEIFWCCAYFNTDIWMKYILKNILITCVLPFTYSICHSEAQMLFSCTCVKIWNIRSSISLCPTRIWSPAIGKRAWNKTQIWRHLQRIIGISVSIPH